ncbi:MAG: ATP-dependent dethiobiotin synthetase BioD, partial [Planctomycetia bacterium]
MTGTDTDVGKTAVAVAIARAFVRAGLRVGVSKPVASGVAPGQVAAGDAARLWEAAGRPRSIEAVCPQAFAAAIAPPRAARVEGRRVDERQSEVAGQIDIERRVPQRRIQPARPFDDHDVGGVAPRPEPRAEQPFVHPTA